MFNTITQQDTLFRLAFDFVNREQEIHSYQININNYTLMISALPNGEVPAQIAEFVSYDLNDLPLSLDENTVELIASYQFRNQMISRLRTEKAEQDKAKRVLDAIKSQIPVDQFDALIAQVISNV